MSLSSESESQRADLGQQPDRGVRVSRLEAGLHPRIVQAGSRPDPGSANVHVGDGSGPVEVELPQHGGADLVG